MCAMSSPKSDKKTALQAAIIALREHAELTQLQLALRLGVTPITTSRWENDATHAPHGDRLIQLSQLAEEEGAPEVAQVFRTAQEREEDLKRFGFVRITDPSIDLQTAIRHA